MRYNAETVIAHGRPYLAVVDSDTGRTALFAGNDAVEAAQKFNDGTDEFEDYITHEAGYWEAK